MLKQRGIKAIIISLLVILSSTCFSLMFVNAYNNFRKEGNDASAATEVLAINNLTDFNNFVSSVNSGTTYEGKTVSLKADINCGGATIGIGGGDYISTLKIFGDSDYTDSTKFFKGTFNGNYHTISNFNMGSKLTYTFTSGSGNAYWYFRGLFLLGSTGKIKYTKFNNVNYTFSSDDAGSLINKKNVSVGLVCFGAGQVEQCIIGNINYNKSSTKNCNSRTGAFTTDGYWCGTKFLPTVKNCLLENTPTLNSVDNFVFGANCNGCVSRYSAASFENSSNCYSSKTGDGFENLSVSSSGFENTWYCYSGYNDGWPYLTYFIKWSEFAISYGNGTTYAFVPTSIASNIYKNLSLTSKTLIVAADSVTAYDKTGNVFSEWEKSYDSSTGKYSVTAKFTPEQYTINFASPTHNGTSINATPSPASVTVSYGDSISVSGSTYTVGSTTVTYTLPTGYEIDSNGLSTVASSGKVKDLGANGATATVTPTVKLKTYTVTFSDLAYATEDGSLTHTLEYGTVITATYTSSTCTYSSGGTKLISYSITNNLYQFLGTGLSNGTTTITSNKSICPNIQQVYIYLEFKNVKKGTSSTSYSPSVTGTKTIAYNASGNYGSGSISAVNGFNNRTITYSIGGVTCTYSVPVIYTLSSEGIDVGESIITVTPVISQEYVKIQFLSATYNGTTITPFPTSEMLIEYNDGVYLVSGVRGLYIPDHEGKSRLEFSFYKAGESKLSYVYYDIEGNSILTFAMDTREGGSATSKITITPILMVKEYDIEFG